VIIVNLLVLVLYHSHHYSAIIYWISSAYDSCGLWCCSQRDLW